MAAHLSEEEQLEALKRWWKQYGTILLVSLAVVAAGFFGWNQYKKQQVRDAENASLAYTKLMETEGGPSAAAAKALAEELGDSLYGDFARLEEARLSVEAGDLDTARQRLQAVVDNAASAQLKPLAKLRLAKVVAAQGEVEPALELLEGEVPGAFVSGYAEAKGDIYMMQNRLPEARTAYESALTALTDPRSMRRSLVQLKLDNTLSADAAAADTAAGDTAAGEAAPAEQAASAPVEEG